MCVCVLCLSVHIGPQTMRTTVMKHLQVTQWVQSKVGNYFIFKKHISKYFWVKIAPNARDNCTHHKQVLF